jgi:hypothetical protein
MAATINGRRVNDSYDDVRRMERQLARQDALGPGVPMVLPPDAEASQRIAESCRRNLVAWLKAAGIEPESWGLGDDA